jgi:hypothetical protein
MQLQVSKMVDVLVLDTVATHNFSENIHTNNGSLCDFVTQLKQELHELRIEIKSLNKIQNYDQNNVVRVISRINVRGAVKFQEPYKQRWRN